jgi:O-antigen/teichoic acid export membrane protein
MARLTLVKNAFANVARGSVAALVALAMPPFLTKALSKDAYGTWLLILQLATYVSFLDFGVQTAVGRFVAHANETGDKTQRDKIISTSLAILMGSALLAAIGTIVLAWLLPNLFPQMPIELQTDARWTLIYVGGSLSIGLPFSVFNGIFVGLQRYDIPAFIIGFSKSLGAIFVVLTAYSTHSIVSMAVVMAVSNLLGYLWQWLACYQMTREIKFARELVRKKEGKDILDYCLSLMIWSFGMLLVSGLDTTIVGYYDYKSVVYYAVSASLISFIAGLQSSLFSVLMPNAAVLSARGESKQLGEILLKSTRYGLLILLTTGLPVIIFARELLTIWMGKDYGEGGTAILQILVAANILRLIGVPYVTMIMGVGQQKLIAMSPIMEALSNLIISIVLGGFMGGVGVALGTLAGSLISISGHIFYNMPRTKKISFFKNQYLSESILIPAVCFSPIILYGCCRFVLEKEIYDTVSGIACLLTSLCLVFSFGISSSERKQLWRMVEKIS